MLERPQAQRRQADLQGIATYLEERGIRNSGRVAQLNEFLQACLDDTDQNSVHKRFGVEYWTYAHEYIDFLADLIRARMPIDTNTLRRIFAGTFDFDEECHVGDDSRNLVNQVRTAFYLRQAGFHTSITNQSDVVAIGRKDAYSIECKRIYSLSKLARHALKAGTQIATNAQSVLESQNPNTTTNVGGVVWFDLTPMFLEFRTIIPTIDSTVSHHYTLHSIRSAMLPVVELLNAPEFRLTKFVVAQGSAIFRNMRTREIEFRVATYACPTRHCSWWEGRRFSRTMSYLQGYEFDPRQAGEQNEMLAETNE